MQDRIIAIIVPLLCCLLFGTSIAGRCGISAPEKSLSELHKVCTSDTLSRKPACVAAIHRFCIQSTYPTINSYETLGVSREYGNGRIGVSCIRSQLIETVPESTLQQYNGGALGVRVSTVTVHLPFTATVLPLWMDTNMVG